MQFGTVPGTCMVVPAWMESANRMNEQSALLMGFSLTGINCSSLVDLWIPIGKTCSFDQAVVPNFLVFTGKVPVFFYIRSTHNLDLS